MNKPDTVAPSGNRCGHDPQRPRKLANRGLRKPLILERLSAKIDAYYEDPETSIPTLNAVNHSQRRQRSERREACLLVLGVLIRYTDLGSLRIGIPNTEGDMDGLSANMMSVQCGISLRRTERALNDLRLAGVMGTERRCKEIAQDVFRSEPAIRALSFHLFTLFGLDRWLLHEQRKARERRLFRIEKMRRRLLAKDRMSSENPIDLIHQTKAATSAPKMPDLTIFRSMRAVLGYVSPS